MCLFISSCKIYLVSNFLTSDPFFVYYDRSIIWLYQQEINSNYFNIYHNLVLEILMLPFVPRSNLFILSLLLNLSLFFFYPIYFCFTQKIFSEVLKIFPILHLKLWKNLWFSCAPSKFLVDRNYISHLRYSALDTSTLNFYLYSNQTLRWWTVFNQKFNFYVIHLPFYTIWVIFIYFIYEIIDYFFGNTCGVSMVTII